MVGGQEDRGGKDAKGGKIALYGSGCHQAKGKRDISAGIFARAKSGLQANAGKGNRDSLGLTARLTQEMPHRDEADILRFAANPSRKNRHPAMQRQK
ncbi:hypothetical protein C2E15_12335 [Mixta gaviniae]|uniref:Uncharacterized protein n=1 Tax=Mixta gaviniae TaxID=665914 RepID=A0A1X1ED62_9GAMM|nr:hypothetical protein C2E15_12335 [Mixta gaviniae]ORM86878.1 hypothetical protein HA44_02420 [Mixta gaviniae]